MLSGDFFTILSLDAEVTPVKVLLELNPGHAIFNGHFPGTPVVPGVCMMQMVHEIMEKIIGAPLRLSQADLMKFLVVIDPRLNKIIQAEVSYKVMGDGSISVNANLSANVVCFKFKGMFLRG